MLGHHLVLTVVPAQVLQEGDLFDESSLPEEFRRMLNRSDAMNNEEIQDLLNKLIERMAQEVAAGARDAGAEVAVKRVPETVPEDLARKSGFKLDQKAPVAKVEELADYDAIIVGTGTRFGRMSSQMANFLDQAGGLWMKGALHGKVGGAFTSTATQHGGQETTLFSIITNLLHFGMVVVGLNYGFAGQMKLDEVTGGAPYGATTITGGDGSRQPSANELAGARYQGRVIAETAKKLHG